MTDNDAPTTEEREAQRDVALRNLKDSSTSDLAVSYLVKHSGQYGEAGNSAVHNFKYIPGIQKPSENVSGIISNSLLDSRVNEEMYSGNVSELGIIQKCAEIIQESLKSVKVSDVYELMGAENPPEEYANQYVGDLDESKYNQILSLYNAYLTSKGVSEALDERAKNLPKGLEKILIGSKE